jgi:putative ABC transport system permease protein
MIKNYFKTAFRHLLGNKVFSLINISGLTIGISAALVIYLVVQFEFSFEKFRKDNDRIYRVTTEMIFPGNSVINNSGVPMPLPKAVRTDLAGIETATHFLTNYTIKVSVPVAGSQSPVEFKKQTEILYADEFYFSLFEYDWLAGSKQVALKDPFQVVLTDERARAYFGNLPANDIIGKTIIYNDTIKTTVSGIVKQSATKATDFNFKEFISYETAISEGLEDNFGGDEWGSVSGSSQFFVKLKKEVKPEQLNTQFAGLRKKYWKEEESKTDITKHHLQSLDDMHFDAVYGSFDNRRQAHRPTLYGLLAVAAFLLLLGCINFINLTTAQATLRAKEIGVRKTLGSGKSQLIFQFLAETFLLTLLATLLSIAITPWLLQMFGGFIPPEISFSSINQPHVWVFLVILVLAMTLFSGSYPAWILTKFRPVTVMKNQLHTSSGQSRKAWLRKTLTVTQFVIAQFLVIATLVVSKQINYSVNKELGYKKDAIVYFPTPWNVFSDKPDNRRFAFLEKIKAMPEVENAGLASTAPAHYWSSSTTLKLNNGKEEVELMTETINADPGYFDIYKLKLAAGNFPSQSDTLKEYLVNEAFVRAFGLGDAKNAIGKTVYRDKKRVPIVGVLKDFHTKSTHQPIGPLAYSSASRNSYTIHVTLKSQDGKPGLWRTAIDKMEAEFIKTFPEDDEFKYKFFDDTIAAFYKKEQNISRLLKWSAGLCIFISCLGLLGLVIYTTNTRRKEVGVRKVLGASVVQIVSLLSKDFVVLVLIAFMIAAPPAWWVMNSWLQDFAYRTGISWWIFALSSGLLVGIALLTLAFQTIRSAMTNPVTSLRTE